MTVLRSAFSSAVALIVGCSSSSSSPSSSSTGGTSSTADEQTAFCDLNVNKCKDYLQTSDCTNAFAVAAECFVKSATDCLTKLATCDINAYTTCHEQAIRACDPASLPSYVAQCKDRNTACKDQYRTTSTDPMSKQEELTGISGNVGAVCDFLPALDASARARADMCLAGACDALPDCVKGLAP